jgi:diaminopropionate ammonia-lyase
MLIANRHASHTDYPNELKTILSVESAEQSRAWLKNWQLLSACATPLWDLPDAAARLGVARLSIKDESVRSPLGSFKALGAPIALVRLILRLWPGHDLDPKGLIQGRYKKMLTNFVVTSATDGNHGKALAAAAQTLGCNCVIVLHANVSAEREQAIAAYGAQIIRIKGNYDESVEEAARLAKENAWHVVSDTSYEGYEAIPRDVMQGYGAIAAEIIEQSESHANEPAFTHIFLQGGVGGLAAGVVSYLWEIHGRKRPRFVVVEPQQADCLYQSALEGRAAKATGSVDSIMAGLACGEASPLAWRILAPCVDDFMTISDEDAIGAMGRLAAGTVADIPLIVGESGAAGYAGAEVAANDSQLARAIGLNKASRVLVISTEGATAPSLYSECVGETADSVLARQAQWLAATIR